MQSFPPHFLLDCIEGAALLCDTTASRVVSASCEARELVAAAPAQAEETVQMERDERDERDELEMTLAFDDGHTKDRPGRRVESASTSEDEEHDYNAPQNQPWNRPRGAAGDDGWKLEA